jgi:hypothetical protein
LHPHDVTPRRTTSVRRRSRARAHRDTGRPIGPRPGAVGTMCLRAVTHSQPLDRCHAAAAHTPDRASPSSTGRPPAARRQPPPHHAVATVGYEARAIPPRSVAQPIKSLPAFPSRAPASSPCLPPSAIGAAGELCPPIVPVTH